MELLKREIDKLIEVAQHKVDEILQTMEQPCEMRWEAGEARATGADMECRHWGELALPHFEAVDHLALALEGKALQVFAEQLLEQWLDIEQPMEALWQNFCRPECKREVEAWFHDLFARDL